MSHTNGLASFRTRGRAATTTSASMNSGGNSSSGATGSLRRSSSKPRVGSMANKGVQHIHAGHNVGMAAPLSPTHHASPVSSASASALLLAAPPPHAAHSAAASSAATAAQQAALPGAGDGTEVDDDRPVSASGRPTLGLAAYRVRKHIGRGKFGVCQLVERLENGKLYVLKAIHLADTSPREREAALAEVETLKRLQLPRPHPFVVRYLESFLWHDTLHIVMTYCAGGDLHAHLKERKAQGRFLPEHVIVDWLIQLLLAIRKCHESHIIHRDIKSSNIFLVPSRITAPPPPPLSTPASAQASTATADGTVDAATAAAAAAVDEPSFTLKLGDFGISKLLNSTSEMAMSIVGTPYSMSPEVCENKPYSFASDIWAIGCTLYEMCTLKHAFDSNNLLGLVWKIVQESYPPIPSLYSVDLSELLSAMLAKDPAARPTVEQMLDLKFIKRRLKAQIEERLRARGEDPAAAMRTQQQQQPMRSGANSRRSSFGGGSSAIVSGDEDEEQDQHVDAEEEDGVDVEPSPRSATATAAGRDPSSSSSSSSTMRLRASPQRGSLQQQQQQQQLARPSVSVSVSGGGVSIRSLTVGVSSPGSSPPLALSPSHAQLQQQQQQRQQVRRTVTASSATSSGSQSSVGISGGIVDGISSMRLPRRTNKQQQQQQDSFASDASAGTASFRAYKDRRASNNAFFANNGGSSSGSTTPRQMRPSLVISDIGGGCDNGSNLQSPPSTGSNSSMMDGGSMLLIGNRGGTGSVRLKRPNTSTTATTSASMTAQQRRVSEQQHTTSPPTSRMVAFAISPSGTASGRARNGGTTTRSPSRASGGAQQLQVNLGETTYEISSPRTPGSFKTAPFSAGGGGGGSASRASTGAPVSSSSGPLSARTSARGSGVSGRDGLTSPISSTDAKARRTAAKRIARTSSFDSSDEDEDEEDDDAEAFMSADGVRTALPKVALFSDATGGGGGSHSEEDEGGDEEDDDVSDEELMIEQLQSQLHLHSDGCGDSDDEEDDGGVVFSSSDDDEEEGEEQCEDNDDDIGEEGESGCEEDENEEAVEFDASGSNFGDEHEHEHNEDDGEEQDDFDEGSEFEGRSGSPTAVSSFGPTSGATAAALGLASLRGPDSTASAASASTSTTTRAPTTRQPYGGGRGGASGGGGTGGSVRGSLRASQRMVVESFSAKHDSPRHRGMLQLREAASIQQQQQQSQQPSSRHSVSSASSSSSTASSVAAPPSASPSSGSRKPPLHIQITRAPTASIPTVPVLVPANSTTAAVSASAASGFSRHGNSHGAAANASGTGSRKAASKKTSKAASVSSSMFGAAAAASSASSSSAAASSTASLRPRGRARALIRHPTAHPSPRAVSTTRPPSLRAKYDAVRERCLRSMSATAFDIVLRHFQQQHLLSPRSSVLLTSARGTATAPFAYGSTVEPPSPSPLSPLGGSSAGGAENGKHVRAVRELLSRAPGCDGRDAHISPETVFLVEQAVYLQQVLATKPAEG